MTEFISAPFEAEMTQAEIEALIDSRFETNYRKAVRYKHVNTVAPVAVRTQGSGWTTTLQTPGLKVIATAGANKLIEFATARVLDDAFFEVRVGDALSLKRRAGAFVGCYRSSGSNPPGQTATMYAGLELGGHGENTPWPAIPSAAVVQLRRVWNADGAIEFLTAKGDGVTPAVVRTLNVAPMDPHGVFFELEQDANFGNIRAYVDGVLAFEVAGTEADFGGFPNADGLEAGIFVTSGTSASGAPQCWFSHQTYEVFWR